MTGQFDHIADFILDPALEVPEAALRHCATLLIDTLGVAAGASQLEVGQIARNFAVDFHGAGPGGAAAPLLFDGRRVSLPGAAWALGTQIDNLDGHDGYNPTKGHIGCAVVPSLFAFAQQHPGLSARAALTTLVMSYEVAARTGLALHGTVSDYHTSGAWNALGVVALGCRLRQTGRDVLRQALGIAEYHGPRSQMMREIANPTMLHDGSGMGALVGCSAVVMAQRGFTGAPAVTVEAHAAIDALHLLMQEKGVMAERVARLHVTTFDEAAQLYAGMPQTTTQAQYSMHFVLAVMLRYGHIAPSHISGEGLCDPAVAALIPKITVTVSARYNDQFPQHRRSEVEVVLTDGQVLQSGQVDARGGPEAWMPDAEVAGKFENFCADVLDPARVQAIWDMRDALLDPDVTFAQLAALVHDGGDYGE